MNVLLIGSGGREHAIALKLCESKLLGRLYIAPGNAGTTSLGTNVDIAVNNFDALAKLAIKENISLVVVGPEDPLVNGISDYFKSDKALQHIHIIGPGKAGARLEGSKEFAKEFMVRHGIPTAGFLSVTSKNLQEGIEFLSHIKAPYVLKADGLAAGKGVLILSSLEEAKNQLKEMLDGKFGKASQKVVIEEFLSGIEMSAFVITDGNSYKILPEAKDYKRIGEGDTGLNTGGMGCVSPVPFADKQFMKKVEQTIIVPTINGLKSDEIPYTGFIFFGLMNCNNIPYVIEYNVRLGDPETEVILPRLKGDLLEILVAAARNKLNDVKVAIDPQACVTVMLVSGGYPGDYEKGKNITNLDKTSGSIVYHAGTKLSGNNIVTNGGRVISISTLGKGYKEALETSFKNAAIIEFEGKYFRRDIGFDLTKFMS
jgi:phosphoribosylamine--glycine ligase